jgi:hypothetical protein
MTEVEPDSPRLSSSIIKNLSIISVVLAVKNVEVKELIAILRPLTSQHGYLVAYQY